MILSIARSRRYAIYPLYSSMTTVTLFSMELDPDSLEKPCILRFYYVRPWEEV